LLRVSDLVLSVNVSLNVSNDKVDGRDGHFVKFELISAESIVRNNDISILLGRLNPFLEGGLGLVLVVEQEIAKFHLTAWVLL